jgi:transcriptional regulator with XRE-family HTH domain
MDPTAYVLKLLRQAADIDQRDLAARSGLPYTTISAYETGHASPQEQTVEKVLAGLGCTRADLEMAERFSSLFVPKIRLAGAPPPAVPGGIADERKEAAELAVEGGRLAYRLLHFVFDLLLSIAEAVRGEGEKDRTPTELEEGRV